MTARRSGVSFVFFEVMAAYLQLLAGREFADAVG
jgi:hypothetical protein